MSETKSSPRRYPKVPEFRPGRQLWAALEGRVSPALRGLPPAARQQGVVHVARRDLRRYYDALAAELEIALQGLTPDERTLLVEVLAGESLTDRLAIAHVDELLAERSERARQLGLGTDARLESLASKLRELTYAQRLALVDLAERASEPRQ